MHAHTARHEGGEAGDPNFCPSVKDYVTFASLFTGTPFKKSQDVAGWWRIV